ncbi:hypothetical protein C2G38_2154761 [Gigaspora rosea]|uniref:Secreted protein n=1 Tax=Gigaspora rosea TaxID=44941 RepID=A0A397WC95_9GLOM|nr:hypothetical protein C2G38_2154761 [Gigaspora rosea]
MYRGYLWLLCIWLFGSMWWAPNRGSKNPGKLMAVVNMTLTKRPLIQDIAMLVVNFWQTALRRLSVHLPQKDLSASNNNNPSRISSSDPLSFNLEMMPWQFNRASASSHE